MTVVITLDHRIAALSKFTGASDACIEEVKPDECDEFYRIGSREIFGSSLLSIRPHPTEPESDLDGSLWLVCNDLVAAVEAAKAVVFATLADDPGDSLTNIPDEDKKLHIDPSVFREMQHAGIAMSCEGMNPASLNRAIKRLLEMSLHGGAEGYAYRVIADRGRGDFLAMYDGEEHDLGDGAFAYRIA